MSTFSHYKINYTLLDGTKIEGNISEKYGDGDDYEITAEGRVVCVKLNHESEGSHSELGDVEYDGELWLDGADYPGNLILKFKDGTLTEFTCESTGLHELFDPTRSGPIDSL
jgi:hypothetical protein